MSFPWTQGRGASGRGDCSFRPFPRSSIMTGTPDPGGAMVPESRRDEEKRKEREKVRGRVDVKEGKK